MKFVKNAAKVFAIGFAILTIARPLSIPRLPPVHVIATANVLQK